MTVVVALSVEKKKAYKRKRDSRPGPCRWAVSATQRSLTGDPRLPSVTLWVSCTPRQNIRKLGDILGRLEKSSAVEYVNRWET